MHKHTRTTPRDKSRTAAAKAETIRRRNIRRDKYAPSAKVG